MRRGDIWTVSAGGDYAGRPRPAVIIQDDSFGETASVTLCTFTTYDVDMPLFRILVEPTEVNGLREPCRLMVDKVMTIPRSKLGEQIGRLAEEDIQRLNQLLLVFLGLAASSKATSP